MIKINFIFHFEIQAIPSNTSRNKPRPYLSSSLEQKIISSLRIRDTQCFLIAWAADSIKDGLQFLNKMSKV